MIFKNSAAEKIINFNLYSATEQLISKTNGFSFPSISDTDIFFIKANNFNHFYQSQSLN
jgi:hypothetical protein